MKAKYLILFLLMCLFILTGSCKNNKARIADNKKELCYVQIDSFSKALSKQGVVHVFESGYPRDIAYYDSTLYVITTKADSCIHALDLKNNKIKSIANVGGGPGEWMSPEFLKNNFEYEGLICYDMKLGKIASITDNSDNAYKKEIPKQVSRVSYLNQFGKTWIGRPTQRGQEHLLEIYNEGSDSAGYCELHSDIYVKKAVSTYVFDPVPLVSANSREKSIIMAMYFFDVIKLYSFDRNCEKIITFTPGYTSQQALDDMVDSKNYVGFGDIYSTKEYCYIHRRMRDGKTRINLESQIIQMKWNGDITNVYQAPKSFTGRFCVDDVNDNIYMLMQGDDKSAEVAYSIVQYKM